MYLQCTSYIQGRDSGSKYQETISSKWCFIKFRLSAEAEMEIQRHSRSERKDGAEGCGERELKTEMPTMR